MVETPNPYHATAAVSTGEYAVVRGLPLSDTARGRLAASAAELEDELREALELVAQSEATAPQPPR